MTKLRTASLTDIGRMRSENEDELLYDEKSQIFGVADGVGGLPGGAEAARETTRIIRQEITSQPANAPLELTRAVHRANDAVIALGHVISPATGIASTLTFGCVRDQRMYLAHVGDSRCYLLRDGNFSRVTEDHSVKTTPRSAAPTVKWCITSNQTAMLCPVVSDSRRPPMWISRRIH
jgi:serine/threonine protein phosphatase PrpC